MLGFFSLLTDEPQSNSRWPDGLGGIQVWISSECWTSNFFFYRWNLHKSERKQTFKTYHGASTWRWMVDWNTILDHWRHSTYGFHRSIRRLRCVHEMLNITLLVRIISSPYSPYPVLGAQPVYSKDSSHLLLGLSGKLLPAGPASLTFYASLSVSGLCVRPSPCVPVPSFVCVALASYFLALCMISYTYSCYFP